MVKFTAAGHERVIVGLGLEEGNVTRMRAGQPVRVRLADLGFTGVVGNIDIVIFLGQDAATLRQQLDPFIGPDTVVHEDNGGE